LRFRAFGNGAVVGIPVSLVLIAVGLVLALAVHSTNSSVDVNTIGWIVFAVGGLGLLLTLLFWDSWAGGGYFRRRTYASGPGYPADPRYAAPRRRTVVEEEDAGPPGPPPY
jgi:Domain of unknown function (DUF6458)